MFKLSQQNIDEENLKKQCFDHKAGALTIFEGRVREHNEGKAVTALEYEVYSELALKEGQKILGEAKARFPLSKVQAVHRSGRLGIGDCAVWIGVSSAHRDEAFKACRYIIDSMKDRLPIWKKEHYTEGPSEWVSCLAHQQHKAPLDEKIYYSKQNQIPSWGQTKQNILKNSKVLVIGAGGLGSPALTYLAGSGLGQILICDGDQIEGSNLHRQFLYTKKNLGQSKAQNAAKRLQEQNPFIKVSAFPYHIDKNNISDLSKDCDLILDCSDNFATKFLVHDHCYKKNISLLQASVYQTEGELHIIASSSKKASCLHCHREGNIQNLKKTKSCNDSGALATSTGLIGTMQATEAISILTKTQTRTYDSIIVQIENWQIQKLQRPKDPNCLFCSDIKESSQKNNNLDQYKKIKTSSNYEVEITNLPNDFRQSFQLIDIREPYEQIDGLNIPGCLNIALSDLDELKTKALEKPSILLCQSGFRSSALARKLNPNGDKLVYSLVGGMDKFYDEHSDS